MLKSITITLIAILVVLVDAKSQSWNIPPLGTGVTPSNTFIGTTDNSDLFIRTANVNRAKITGSGFYAGGFKLYSNYFTLGNSGTSYFNWSSSGNLYFRTLTDTENPSTSTDRMILTNDGRLGIGVFPRTVAAMEVYKASNPSLMVTSSTAMAYFALATGDYNWSNSALNNDAVLSTNPGATGNLLLQVRGLERAIKFVTQYGGYEGVKMTVNYDGKVGIGTTNFVGDYKLYVGGRVICEELKVKLQGNWPDFVFAKNHQLLSLDSVETYIKENNHLPNVPSAQEVKENGIEAGEMLRIQMQKIEELTLYMIEMKKENDELKHRINALETK
jgi:hypothetical protein